MEKISFHEEEYRYSNKVMDANRALYALLAKYGWKHTCNNPSCFWMWEKEIDGKMILVSDAVALDIEKSLHVDENWPENDTSQKEV